MNRTERYAEMVTEYEPHTDSVDSDPGRYLVVACTELGTTWFNTSDSLEDALDYAAGEVCDGWEPQLVVDLDTGREGTPRVEITCSSHWNDEA